MVAKRMLALAAAGLLAACSGTGGEPAEANGGIANAAEAPAAPEAKGGEAPAVERDEAEQRPQRELPDYAGFRMSEADREARLSRTYNSCMEEAGTTADYRQCSSAEFARVEREMDRALEQAAQGLPEGAGERLRSDQRRWREGLPGLCQRQLEEEGAEGGSMDLLTLDNCSLGEAIRRTSWLESIR